MPQKRIKLREPLAPNIHGTIFIVLVAVICIERVISLFIISAGLNCEAQRDLSVGESVSTAGVYHWLLVIALASVLVTMLAAVLRYFSNTHVTWSGWLLPIINILIAVGIMAVSAIPWAYYNVGHPLSDRIYHVSAFFAPDAYFESPTLIREYLPDADVWRCDSDSCTGRMDDTQSVFVHRTLNVSFKNMAVSSCMSNEFNRATKKALGDSIEGYSGDKRRFARVYFDERGRFVGPHDRWVFTDHLKAQLTEDQLQPSEWDFEEMLLEVSDSQSSIIDTQIDLPAWTDWRSAETLVLSGRVVRANVRDGLLFGIETEDGLKAIGTMPSSTALKRTLLECGIKCDGVVLVEE